MKADYITMHKPNPNTNPLQIFCGSEDMKLYSSLLIFPQILSDLAQRAEKGVNGKVIHDSNI